MAQKCIKAGDLYEEELIALDLEIRREIIGFIGAEIRRIKEIEKEIGLKDELEDHLSILERALLVERDDDCYRLTPRCVAYLDETIGYEWRR